MSFGLLNFGLPLFQLRGIWSFSPDPNIVIVLPLNAQVWESSRTASLFNRFLLHFYSNLNESKLAAKNKGEKYNKNKLFCLNFFLLQKTFLVAICFQFQESEENNECFLLLKENITSGSEIFWLWDDWFKFSSFLLKRFECKHRINVC